MKWTKYTLKTTTAAVDLVSDMLSELGVEGIEIEDKVPLSEEDKQKMFIDILPELPEDDGVAMINFYMDIPADADEVAEAEKLLIAGIASGLDDLSSFVDTGEGTVTVSVTEDKDWINNWKEFFKPFRVDDSIVIKPTWENLSEKRPGDMVIEIDPGTAFGTGSHETTKLCILNLKKYLKQGDRLLDVGCGSGILSIIGFKLGANSVTGVDIDSNAVRTSGENTEVNKIKNKVFSANENLLHSEDMIEYIDGNMICSQELREKIGLHFYDVVVANILADIIIPLSAVIGGNLKSGGIFISSGIINTKQNDVEKAVKQNGFDIIEITTMGDWVSIVARKR